MIVQEWQMANPLRHLPFGISLVFLLRDQVIIRGGIERISQHFHEQFAKPPPLLDRFNKEAKILIRAEYDKLAGLDFIRNNEIVLSEKSLYPGAEQLNSSQRLHHSERGLYPRVLHPLPACARRDPPKPHRAHGSGGSTKPYSLRTGIQDTFTGPRTERIFRSLIAVFAAGCVLTISPGQRGYKASASGQPLPGSAVLSGIRPTRHP